METISKDHAKVNPDNDEGTYQNARDKYKIVYVLGGPGSGKDTQCAKVATEFGFCHFCVGELLEKEVVSGSQHGPMIKEYKDEGKLLPSEIVISILQREMDQSPIKRFLINGFPRNEENLVAAQNIMKIEPEFVLFLECSKEMMTSRNQGRRDDNEKTAAKRLKVFFEQTIPVIDYYSFKGKVVKINGEQPKEAVFTDIKTCFLKLSTSENQKTFLIVI